LYNLSVYGNLILNKNSEDFILTEHEYIPNSKNYGTSKLLIGDTIDYKLFISILVDNNFNYSDKYFTLNITRTLLKFFIVITIISVSFYILAWIWSNIAGIDFEIDKCREFIIKECYFINDGNDGNDWIKLGIIMVIFLILFSIFIVDITMPQKKYDKYIIDKSEETTLTKTTYKYVNLEKYLNANSNDSRVFNDNNDNIDILINHLKGYNIHTIKNISHIDKITEVEGDKITEVGGDKLVEYNKFIDKIKIFSAAIAKAYDNDKKIYENKDLDFIKLIIIFLNNIKINNNDKKKGLNETDKDFLHPRVFSNYIINIITGVIPGISDIEDIKKNKVEYYDLYNILIGGIPLSKLDGIATAGEKPCSTTNRGIKLNSIDGEKKSCIYDNYLSDLKEYLYTDSIWKNKLKGTLIMILILAIISIIIIIILFIYIFVNYNKEYKNYAKITSVKLMRDSNYKNVWYLGMGMIINSLIKK
jgi:hypothetical protein